jgi:hypothetical protein
MTTNEDVEAQFRDLLTARLADEPPAPSVQEVIARSRRDFRRHRARGVSAAVVVLLAAAVVPLTLLRSGHSGDGVAAVDPNGTRTDSGLIGACRDGNQAQAATDALFASGTPRVVAQATTDQVTTAVLVSADDRYWARCFVNAYQGAEFGSGMTVFDSTKTDKGLTYSDGYTCRDLDGPPSPPCATFKVDYSDRLPAAVAAVEFTTIDNKTTRVDTVDGFVFFHYVADVPDGVSTTEDGPTTPTWLTRVAYLDAGGNLMAAQNMGTSKPTEMQVDALPLLKAYPALRQSAIGITGNKYDDKAISLNPRLLKLAATSIKTNDLTAGHTISSATATIGRGLISGTQSNTGQDCDSGLLVQVLVIGDFSDIPVSGFAPDPGADGVAGNGPTTAVELTVDGESGATCVVEARTGPIGRPPFSTPVSLG